MGSYVLNRDHMGVIPMPAHENNQRESMAHCAEQLSTVALGENAGVEKSMIQELAKMHSSMSVVTSKILDIRVHK